MGTIFWVPGTKSTSNRWGGGFHQPRPRLSLQTPASDIGLKEILTRILTGLLEFLIFSSEFQVLNITEMTSGCILDLFDFDEDENSNLDDETVCQT